MPLTDCADNKAARSTLRQIQKIFVIFRQGIVTVGFPYGSL